MSDKLTGSFYTPTQLVGYMINYIKERVRAKRILEPSAGDGRFISQLRDVFNAYICAVEIDGEKLSELMAECSETDIWCGDFLDFVFTSEQKFDLIIGNPPYISKKNMSQVQRDKSVKILDLFNLPQAFFQNMWVSFLVGSLHILTDHGAIFLVLPFEFLQVQYAEGLRAFLEDKFNTIEIITFSEKVFNGIEQDICLVFLANENEKKPYIQYITIQGLNDPKIVFESVIMRNKPLKKWANCIINDDETEQLKRLAERYPPMYTFGDISPGIVTAANSYFIINSEMARRLNIQKSALLPIISKSSDLASKFIFTNQDFEDMDKAGKKVWMLNLSGLDEKDFSEELKEYLNSGIEQGISEGYKCKRRTHWYDVPMIRSGELSFFKRYNIYPRIVINGAMVHTTDVAYNIRPYEGIDASSLAFCFYNSLTLSLCEYNGRFYGGGVGELIPSEFKALHVPYQPIKIHYVNALDRMIRNSESFINIVSYVDQIILNLDTADLILLHKIRDRYLKRRLS
jgi:adenine-specific DNA-methyltransferase